MIYDPFDLWMGNFSPVPQPTITVFSETGPSEDSEAPAPSKRRIGFAPWTSETDATSASAGPLKPSS